MRNTVKAGEERLLEIQRKRDKFIIELYRLKYTITEIGEVMNLSQSRIFQIIKTKVDNRKE